MNESVFRTQRRQKFLTEQFFELNKAALANSEMAFGKGIVNRQARGSFEPVGQAGIFQCKLNRLKLEYTAGSSLSALRPLFADAMGALGVWNDAERADTKQRATQSDLELREDSTGLYFEDLGYYQLALEVASLGALFGDGAAVRKLAEWVRRYRGTDLLFEFIIAPAVADPRDNTDFFHDAPYDPLIDAFYSATTPEESAAFMHKYLDGWYKAFEGVPWHNGHLKPVEGEYIPYYGYWSFEAAAVCVIHGIDDTSFRDHLVYPKDLADWARANRSLASLKPNVVVEKAEGTARLRCEAGNPCPQTGWWFTPAQADSRRQFETGDLMPKVGSDYGATIWQWDEKQY